MQFRKLLIAVTATAATAALHAQPSLVSDRLVTLDEVFHTDRDEGDNVDSPAVWHGPDGQHWLLATAKEGDAILAFDATSGDFVRRFGDGGAGAGQFQRPNGIWVIDDMMLVVERDNQRIQVFTLPDFESIGMMTHEDLRLPYGLSVTSHEQGGYDLYVTDNFNPALEGYPPEEELDERIHHFRFRRNGDSVESEHIGTFGDISGEGLLTKVESLYFDPYHDRLLIADEAFSQRSIKIYNSQGQFTGEVIPDTFFASEPEGIALYECDAGEGYWIIADQHESDMNRFQFFDRRSLAHLGTLKGAITRNTDGIWLSQQSFGPFPDGALYPVHDDGSVTAMDWQEIADGLSLTRNCTDHD
ncbi:MAG: phytase precursor [Pseudomonadota bacterium]